MGVTGPQRHCGAAGGGCPTRPRLKTQYRKFNTTSEGRCIGVSTRYQQRLGTFRFLRKLGVLESPTRNKIFPYGMGGAYVLIKCFMTPLNGGVHALKS